MVSGILSIVAIIVSLAVSDPEINKGHVAFIFALCASVRVGHTLWIYFGLSFRSRTTWRGVDCRKTAIGSPTRSNTPTARLSNTARRAADRGDQLRFLGWYLNFGANPVACCTLC